MTERKYGDAPAGERTRSAAVPDEPTLGTRPCPHCGAGNHPDASVCEECGEPLRVRARNVRCRHCGKDAPSSLVICPNCGRELKAAPSRWFVWGLPVLLIVLFAVVLAMRTQRSPLRLVRDLSARGVDAVSNLSVQMDPENPLEMTPIVEEIDIATPPSQEELAATVAAQEADDAGNVPNAGEAEAALEEPIAEAVVLVAPTNTPVVENTPVPTATDAPTPTDVPTATSCAHCDGHGTGDADQHIGKFSGKPSSRTPAATAAPTAAEDAAVANDTVASNAGRAACSAHAHGRDRGRGETAPAVDPTALALARAHGDADPAADGDADTGHLHGAAGDTFLGIAGRLGVTADASRGQPVVGRGRACCGRARC
ncbi:MAG: zinc ribbon domain-containing protein [Caldilineaceae bacterium]